MHRLVLACLVVVCVLALSVPADAGITADNVIVVVNADSIDSRTIANHYVELRKIPSTNVIFLRDVPSDLIIEMADFKSKILLPVLNELNGRRIARQTRVIAYSAGFPTSVRINEHTQKLPNSQLREVQRPLASINGLTFLYKMFLADNPAYLGLESNFYARGPFEREFRNPYLKADLREQYQRAADSFENDEFAESADEFEKLFKKSPTIAPLAIRAAEAKMKAGDKVAAKNLIVKAVRAGWTSWTALEMNETIAPLVQEPPLTALRSKLSDRPATVQPPIGFSGDVAWLLSGHPVSNMDDGIPYLLSCMLAVVHPRGSTVEQAKDVLSRAAQSDHTYPEGSFWFTLTSNVRTKSRRLGIVDALLWLGDLNLDAKIVRNTIPDEGGNCIGLMLGTAGHDLSRRKWNFVPGAISDNLTSFGGAFGSANQSKLTDLLHAGAAMSSGAVHEPYSLQAKFPLPIMYGYYASGVTAIEAFYLSVASPYQLLIVGDPLAQPFARPPSDVITVTQNTSADQTSHVTISRLEASTAQPRTNTSVMDIYLEGKLMRSVRAVSNININLPAGLSGEIELRVVLVGNSKVQPRIDHREWIRVGSTVPPIARLDVGNVVTVECPDADSIDLMHHGEVIQQIDGTTGRIQIDRNSLGEGPIRLRPIAKFGNNKVPGRELIIN